MLLAPKHCHTVHLCTQLHAIIHSIVGLTWLWAILGWWHWGQRICNLLEKLRNIMSSQWGGHLLCMVLLYGQSWRPKTAFANCWRSCPIAIQRRGCQKCTTCWTSLEISPLVSKVANPLCSCQVSLWLISVAGHCLPLHQYTNTSSPCLLCLWHNSPLSSQRGVSSNRLEFAKMIQCNCYQWNTMHVLALYVAHHAKYPTLYGKCCILNI